MNIFTLLIAVYAQDPIADRVLEWPGYPSQNFKSYSGFIKQGKQSINYIFFESQRSPNDPVVVWLGGGPGCSCLLGLIREIGPFIIPNEKTGLDFVENPYAMNKIANVLFLDIPAGVGYSTIDDPDYIFNDKNTGRDTYTAILLWFRAYTDFQANNYYIGGESYSGIDLNDVGMYVTYTARALVEGNKVNQVINLKGVLIGNGIISTDIKLLDSANIKSKLRRSFYDLQTQRSLSYQCALKPESVSCKVANDCRRIAEELLNPYNVYDHCWQDSSQANDHDDEGAPCIDAGPLIKYFNSPNVKTGLHIPDEVDYVPCNNYITENYQWDPEGAGILIPYLFNNDVQVIHYSGNTDSVCSYTYTLESLAQVQGLKIVKPWTAFGNIESQKGGQQQLAGWIIEYNYMKLYIIRGAGHLAPYDQKSTMFQIFKQHVV